MIPLRIAIEGFLSYRDQVQLTFDGAPIWMLTGDNGVGKSTVFDAITFALYGVHRGGKQNVNQIINDQADRLSIEFDFFLGDDCYRVQRTVPRRGRASFQAAHLSGPNAPYPGRTGTQPIPETDSKEGLTKWVIQQLGMDERAFLMSVLLQQGKSDALLEAKPEARHGLLSQLVDLSRYQQLHEHAKRHLDVCKNTASHCEEELAKLPPVDAAQIVTLAACVELTQKRLCAVQDQLELLSGLMVHAERWSALVKDRDRLIQSRDAMRLVIGEADQIERNADRQAELGNVLPDLFRIVRDSQRLDEHLFQANEQQDAAVNMEAQLAELCSRQAQVDGELQHLSEEKKTAQIHERTAFQRLRELDGHIHQLDELTRLREEITCCERELAAFPLDLDLRAEHSQHEIEELADLRAALPLLTQYAAARDRWNRERKQRDISVQEQSQAAERVAATQVCKRGADIELQEARVQVSTAKERQAVADSALAEARKQLERFEEVASEPNCSYCGQKLTVDHLSIERQRLADDLTEKTRSAEEVTCITVKAVDAERNAEALVQRCRAEHEKEKEEERKVEERLRDLARELDRAQEEGQQALGALRAGNLLSIPLPDGKDIVSCFVEPYPTDTELAHLKTRVASYKTAQQAYKSLQVQINKRNQHQLRCQNIQCQIEDSTLAN